MLIAIRISEDVLVTGLILVRSPIGVTRLAL